ncbi:cytochrome aa3 quinol oxidase subunit II [Thalassobacillus hwangdonensis]|uniref:Quinol oxidase subunit 2 n=1 Tax=Thalassobacillus hwangdonensis TaxID=546108 RepID=A0ABW3L6H3_9BACI
MKNKWQPIKKWLALMPLGLVLILSGCSEMAVMDPKGPVGQIQKDLIVYSLWFMLGIIIVVFSVFAYVVIKYRDRPGRKASDYAPHMHGSTKLEIIWTIIPFVIVGLLSVATVEALYDLEKPPESSQDKEPLVVYATSADWKWFFSYPEQGIETVDYLHIPTDRAIEFRLTSADSMAALWIPRLGGQKYGMAGMENKLYLQADEEGVYDGRNSNFNGEGFAMQTFKVHAESEDEFNDWVTEVQQEAPELTKEKYHELLTPGLVDTMEFSNTHLDYVDHGTNDGRGYSIELHRDGYQENKHYENHGEKGIQEGH